MSEKGTYELTHFEDGTSTLVLSPAKGPVVPREPIDAVAMLATRKDARYLFPNWSRDLEKIRWITVHHSAGSRAAQNIKWWHRYHTQTKSWSRVGYHYGIAAMEKGDDIELYKLNQLEWHTWHDARNFDTVGVCMAGDLRPDRDVEPNAIQCDCFGRLMFYLLPQLPNLIGIVGHKHWQPTACPGAFEDWKPKLIEAAYVYGVDISAVIANRALRQARVAVFDVAGISGGPPKKDYDEELGLCNVDGD